MLDQNLKNQLAQYLDLLKTEVTIGLSVANDENSKKVKEFIDDVASLSEKIKVEEKKLKYTPSFDLKGDFDHGEIIFAGLPLGHEFASFALALLQVGGISPKVDDKTIQRIKSLDESMDFETVVSLSCHNCPDVVQALNIMAIINPKINHTMIEGGMFKDLAESREVLAVPAIFKDGNFFEGGKQSMDNLLDLLGSEKDTSHFENKGIFDVLVIGGGPAAATAGIYAARKGLKTGILADEFGGQVNETLAIENIPGFKYTEGPDFMVQMKDQVSSLGVDIMTGALANDIKRLENEKVVEISLDNDITLRAKTVILATGARWRLIGIPGEVEFRNKGVAYCTHCDGPLFKDKPVAVIGGGNSGVEAAIDLAAMASKVTVLEFLPELKADKILQDKLRSLENVEIITNAQTTGLYGDGKVENLEFTDRVSGEEKNIDIDGCFIQVGLVPNTEWLKESDLDLNKFGEIPTNKDGSTNIEGVFAAGDATETAFKQIVIAAGTGATAALGAFNYLVVN
ncbi:MULTISPECIES: alkyl hydroperoxide reductase subunit F [Anaerococcus]|uniref:Alkyl hydroperoxide reductase, F subunit n=1 Tax=Anaerococcus prevotii ACS-065-V-Col13 TaxID=879305 RepID=F0GVZ4_9FIRM|nr:MULTISPECIES: alkyl hydroperoxide reductase subunit F [Anaerococcus]EGC82007.1 alkyl hydroperoxide reductase, F subunit [Anaerococcus prevotii ACS-065-V-Col13]MDU5148868.1 alkyl hydroperoxide reductase subunit F [Anaerococcus prevotii]